ncbi:hypothetical protein AVEN_173316-1 [Araneus ventricosus]|uniref:Uncharacterized protein n=1 Tax=Araneus ventricosus TaxID=182803 RepID=A0A4Y2WPL7_ARAVE|nr:hypothetical protein AVEN_173316-1 [Araneus ventricosus]
MNQRSNSLINSNSSLSLVAGHSREGYSVQLSRIQKISSLILVEKLGKSFTDVPKTRFKVAEFFPPFTPPPPDGGFRVSFLALTRGTNVGRSSVLPLPSRRGPRLEMGDEVLELEFL